MTQVGVFDDAQLLELLQIPVDGGEMDVGGPPLDGCGQLFGGQMAVRLEEDLENDPAGRRGPASPGPDQGEDVIDRGRWPAGGGRGRGLLAHW